MINDTIRRFVGSGKLYWFLREKYSLFVLLFTAKIGKKADHPIRILFYHVTGLSYGGTEKSLQILAKHLPKDKYEVYFSYSYLQDKDGKNLIHPSRLAYIKEGSVIPLPFNYSSYTKRPPYALFGMTPHVYDVVKALDIDLFISAGSGHANFPFTAIRRIPIILLNIFGQPNLQKNITRHLCISKEVAEKLLGIVPKEKIQVMPVPSEGPTEQSIPDGKQLRSQNGILDTDFVFGRIGRGDNGIYDSIAIESFKEVVKEFSNAHYLVVSAPLDMVNYVKQNNIPNVHFIDGDGSEKAVWAFHQAIDVLAHSRKDGESFGLNIVESMLCGKPILTHKSPIWNAHLEYLDKDCAFIAEIGDVLAYTQFMKWCVNPVNREELRRMGNHARQNADQFLIQNIIGKFERVVKESLACK